MAGSAEKSRKTSGAATPSGAARKGPNRVQTEVERKYDVDAETRLPELIGVGAVASAVREEPVTLRAEYFDTADRALSRGRITLRRRAGGADEGWHVKLPGSAGRTEIHAPLTSGARVPASVREPVLGYVGRAPLEPLAQLETVRGITRVADADGRCLAEIADDLVIAVDARTGRERRWREWEVELVDVHGDEGESVLDTIQSRLLSAGARPAASASKLARATGGPIDDSAPAPTDGGEVALAAMRELLRDLRAIDPRVRLEEEDALHRMRVLTRRLRTVLAGSRSVLDRASTDPLRDELRWLAGVLGAARDEEVLEERLRSAVTSAGRDLPEGLSLPNGTTDESERRRDLALGRVARTLRGGRYLSLLSALDSLLAEPPRTKRASSSAKKLVARSLAKELSRLDEARAASTDDAVAARHEIRKSAKRLRYLVQAWTAVVPAAVRPRHRRLERAAERIADTLGEERDALALRDRLRAEAGADDARGGSGFLLGVVYAEEGRRAAEAAEAADEAIARFDSLSR